CDRLRLRQHYWSGSVVASVSSSGSGRGEGLSPRQERIADRLLAQVGPGPAAFFRNACALVRERPPQPAVTHLVAHLLREVESAVRSVLEPPDAAAGARTGKHQARIRTVLNVLGIAEDDGAAQFWLALAGEENMKGLAA